MKRIENIAAIMLALLAVGCQKVVEFDLGDVKPYVVVNARPEADSALTVYLTYSRFFLDGHAFQSIDDANMTLNLNDQLLLPTPAGNGLYQFACQPQPGDTLTMHLELEGYDPITAGTRIPQRPQFEVVEFLLDTTSPYCHYGRLKVKVIDPQGENYYAMSAQGYETYWDYNDDTTLVRITDLTLSTDDMIFTDATSLDFIVNGGESTVSSQKLRFSDELFNGQEHIFTLSFMLYRDSYDSIDWTNYPYNFAIHALSRDLYRYESTTESQANNDGLGLFTEPTQIYCNIDGGIGIFAASSQVRTKLNPTYQTFPHNDYYDKAGTPRPQKK